MPAAEHTYRLEDSTLAELRDIVAATEHLPADSTVRVRTRFAWSPNGGTIARLHVEP